MERPKKEKELKHNNRVYLRLTDFEFAVVTKNARDANLSLAEYARQQIMKGKVTARYEIVVDVPEIKRLTAEFGKIGSNLNQIARYFNSGGLHSKEKRKEISQCIADICELKYSVQKMADDFHSFADLYKDFSEE